MNENDARMLKDLLADAREAERVLRSLKRLDQYEQRNANHAADALLRSINNIELRSTIVVIT